MAEKGESSEASSKKKRWPEVKVECLWNEADLKKVCEMLCRFIEAKQRSSEPYCPKTLLQLLISVRKQTQVRASLQLFNPLKSYHCLLVKIIRTRCSTFKTLQDEQSTLIFNENVRN